MNRTKKMKIFWTDASIFSQGRVPTELAQMLTTGNLVRETEEYYLLENWKTKKLNARRTKLNKLKIWLKDLFRKQPKGYFFIPKGMVK